MSSINTLAGSVRLDSYNGNATVVFGTDPNPGRNFSFGRAKACLLLDAIASHGVDAVLALVATVAGRTEGQGAATSKAKADTPSVPKAEKSDTATVSTSTVPPAKAATKAATTPKPQGKMSKVERARLVKIVQNAGIKGHGLAYKWKAETLLTKVAEIEASATKAETPISDKDLNRGLALAGIKAETPSVKAEPTIVHTATIKGKTYVLLSTGDTKLKVNRADGKLQLRKTDMILPLPVKSDEKTVLRTFRDGATQFVLYTDGTWKAVERVDRSV